MKILHIVPSYFPATRYGGPIQSVHDLNKNMVRLGHRVTVFTTNADGEEILTRPVDSPVFLDGVEIWYFPVSFRSWFYSSALKKALAQRAGDFDVIHITSVFLAASALGAYYAKKFRKPYVISPRGSLMIEPLKKSSLKKKIYLSLIESRNLAGAAAIHFTTLLEEREYGVSGLPINKSLVIPNFLEPLSVQPKRGSFRSAIGCRTEDKLVLSLSRLNWKKGFDTLIPAFAEVAKKIPKAKLIIAGRDEDGYKRQIESWIADYQLENKIVFTGELRGEQKLAAYMDSDIFVLPSYAENFAMTVLESARCGLPSIVTSAVGLAEEVLKYEAGLVVEKTPDSFSEAIIYVLTKDLIRKEMSKRAQIMAAAFVPDKLAPLWEEGYYRFIK